MKLFEDEKPLSAPLLSNPVPTVTPTSNATPTPNGQEPKKKHS